MVCTAQNHIVHFSCCWYCLLNTFLWTACGRTKVAPPRLYYSGWSRQELMICTLMGGILMSHLKPQSSPTGQVGTSAATTLCMNLGYDLGRLPILWALARLYFKKIPQWNSSTQTSALVCILSVRIGLSSTSLLSVVAQHPTELPDHIFSSLLTDNYSSGSFTNLQSCLGAF